MEEGSKVPGLLFGTGAAKGESMTARSKTRANWKLTAWLLIAVLSLPLLFPEPVRSADDAAVKKFVGRNWVNGRSWEMLDYPGKLGFVCGIFDGITLFWSLADNEKTRNRSALTVIYNSLSLPSSLTVGDIVKGMDEFYKDQGNADLPAICAYMHYVSTSRGDSPESINKRVATWRKMFKQ